MPAVSENQQQVARPTIGWVVGFLHGYSPADIKMAGFQHGYIAKRAQDTAGRIDAAQAQMQLQQAELERSKAEADMAAHQASAQLAQHRAQQSMQTSQAKIQAVEQQRAAAEQQIATAQFQSTLGQPGQDPGAGQPGVIPPNMQFDQNGNMPGGLPGADAGQDVAAAPAAQPGAGPAPQVAQTSAQPSSGPADSSQASSGASSGSSSPSMQKAASGHLSRWLRKAAQEFENQSTAEPMAEVQSLAADATCEDVPPEPTSEHAQDKADAEVDPFDGSVGTEESITGDLVDIKDDQVDAPIEKAAGLLTRYLRKAAQDAVEPAPTDVDMDDPEAVEAATKQAKKFNAAQRVKRIKDNNSRTNTAAASGMDPDSGTPPEKK